MRIRVCSLVLVALAAVAAQANLVTNGSFEDGAFVPNGDNTMSLGVGSTTMTGWTVTNASLAWIQDPNPFNGLHASDGIKSLDLTDYAGVAGGVKQSFATLVGQVYTVDFDLGANAAYGQAGLRVLAAGVSQDFSLSTTSGQLWEHHSWSFTAVDALTTLEMGHYFGANNYTGVDNVVVTGVVPEPMTMALLALAPLALRRRRK